MLEHQTIALSHMHVTVSSGPPYEVCAIHKKNMVQ